MSVLYVRNEDGTFSAVSGSSDDSVEDGGYYTPSVTQPDDDKLEFTFTASKEGMPVVQPVQVVLPVSSPSGGNVELDTSLTQSGKAADAKAVGDALANIKAGCVNWLDPEEGEAFTSVTKLPDEPDVPDIPDEPDEPEVTLTGISASYTGGDVLIGTALSALVGIVVTASYSDGTSKTVTDYTLSGEIVEGSSTITVTYKGMTATFTVMGVEETPEVTLTNISATYTGGNVAVGTAVTDLTGVTVTAHYSDGSTAPVTDFTLSGTIAEGNNTITVSYGGKTATFTVTGEEEENGEDFTGTENAFERDGYLYINTLTIDPMFDRSHDSDKSDYHETIWRTDNGGGLFDASALSDGTIFKGVVKPSASSTDEPYYVDAGGGNAWFYIPLDDWNNAGGSPAAYLYSLTERFPIKLASSYDVFDFNSDMETIPQGSKYFTSPSISNGFIVGSIFFAMDIKWHPVCNVNAFAFTSGETECYKIGPYASGWTEFHFSIPSEAFGNDLSNVSISSIVEYVRSIGLKFWGGA